MVTDQSIKVQQSFTIDSMELSKTDNISWAVFLIHHAKEGGRSFCFLKTKVYIPGLLSVSQVQINF